MEKGLCLSTGLGMPLRGVLNWAMLLSSFAQNGPPAVEHDGNTPNMDEGADAVQAPVPHQPPSWLGWLLLISLLVMLNTHLFITLAAGVDQYGLYAADTTVKQPYPAALAQSPYPALLSFLFSVFLALVAYGVYRFIWWRFTSPRSAQPDNGARNPFKQNAIALAIPVFIAMVPSIVLGYTDLKAYFVIVGALIVIVLCVVGALKDPDVEIDAGTRGYWFNVAVVAIFVMMGLSVIVALYYQFAPATPPTSNILWELEWNLYPVDEFEARAHPAMLTFGLVSLAYMVAALGGVLLATLHPPRIGMDSTSPEREPAQTTNVTVLNINPPAPEEREEGWAEDWARDILRRLSEEVPVAGQDTAYLAVLAGLEKHLSFAEYNRLMDERHGYLSEADILVDKAAGIVRNRTANGFERMRVQTNPDNTRFIAICLYSRWPNRQFTAREIIQHLKEETGQEPGNVNDTIRAVRDAGLPVISGDRVTYLKGGTKVCFLDRLETNI